MNEMMARTIVETLSKGIDPLTGRVLPETHLCSNEIIQDALETVLSKCSIESNEQFLQRNKQNDRRQQKAIRRATLDNAGSSWLPEEEDTILELYARKYSLQEIARITGRTGGEISAKLRQLRRG